MGVPKFFRWLSERYPKINQRYGSPPNPKTCQRYFDKLPPEPFEHPDPMSTCGITPEVDRLYLDMNGIIHGCSHNNSDDEADENVSEEEEDLQDKKIQITNEEIFRNVCYYLDRVIGDMVKPKELVYMAIDGIAPRAKLNQQRSRRYRSGTEGAIEENIYDAHAKAMERNKMLEEQHQRREESLQEDAAAAAAFDVETGYSFGEETIIKAEDDGVDSTLDPAFQEIAPGRFKGKFETASPGRVSPASSSSSSSSLEEDTAFHSNVITPGTPFFQEFSQHLEHFVKYKLSTDPKWKGLTIILSGPNVPGEGEHKIMQFIRDQKMNNHPKYHPNLKHCIMGQDGDLIMLGLVTHEPNLVLLRERVLFNRTKERLQRAVADSDGGSSLDAYIHNPHFEFLHMGVLRDYLAFEFETSNVLGTSPWDLEHVIDDFVFLTFFVGNDFLPHMPALDIADNAFDLLFFTYKQCRKEWLNDSSASSLPPYLTDSGNIVSGRRLEEFLSAVGSHEVAYYDKKKQGAEKENTRMRKAYKRFGMESTIPDADIVASKEESDRQAYREMLERIEEDDDDDEFMPVMTGDLNFQPVEEHLEEGLVSRMGNLLQNSLSSTNQINDTNSNQRTALMVDDQDVKGRYYYDKFQFSPVDSEKHLALRKAYMEGLVWNLKYYYEGCVSWEWFYPYHYGPMLSDLVNLDEILHQISFKGKMGSPLKPFEQLMGCMPPSQSHHLPEPYRWLMTDPESPIIDFYPQSFTIDMNGKRWPWEAVVLLPFIDSKRLLDAMGTIDESLLTEGERQRNSVSSTIVLVHDPQHQSESIAGIGTTEGFQDIKENKTRSTPLELSEWSLTNTTTEGDVTSGAFKPALSPGVQVPLPGYGSLRDAPIHSLWRRKLGINVFGSRSRYKTSCLEISSVMPPIPAIESLAPKLIGTSIFVNYPYFIEGLITAVSDETSTIRGSNATKRWTEKESERWKVQRDGMTRLIEYGEGYTGTGGITIPEDQAVTLSVRPFQDLVKTKGGKIMKRYATFEVEVPLISTFWNPSQPDPRLQGIPSRLEKNAYEIAMPLYETYPKKLTRLKTGKKNRAKRGKLLPPKRKSQNDSSHLEDSASESSYKPTQLNKGTKTRTKRGNLLPPKRESSNDDKLTHDSTSVVDVPQASLLPPSNLTSKKEAVQKRGFSTAALPSESEIWCNLPAIVSRNTKTYDATHSRFGIGRISSSQVAARPARKNIDAFGPRYHLKKPGFVRPAALTRNTSGVRGRLFAAGVVAAAFLFSPAGATQSTSTLFGSNSAKASLIETNSKLWRSERCTLASFAFDDLQKALQTRGGESYEDGDTTTAVPPLEFAHGTTTISFIFQGGIIAAVDSRASLGSFVGSKTTEKVLPVNSHILGTMAGGAADCMFWIRKLKSEALLHELTEGYRMSVARASRLLSNALYQNRKLGLSVGTMIMGFDKDGPPRIYYVDNSGVRIEGDLFAVGSGSTFALGILDNERKHAMTEDEAIALGIKAIRHATFRDAYSGGFINVFLITKEGWKKVYTEDLARSPDARVE